MKKSRLEIYTEIGKLLGRNLEGSEMKIFSKMLKDYAKLAVKITGKTNEPKEKPKPNKPQIITKKGYHKTGDIGVWRA